MRPIPSCDLHVHSHYSDGILSPEQIVAEAARAGLCAVSVTDHDTAAGQEETLEAGARMGIDVVTGIEFSVREKDLDIHILGYCFDHGSRSFLSVLRGLEEARIRRVEYIVEKLRTAGVEVTIGEIMEEAGIGTVGRPHVARVMMRKGIVAEFQEAFNRYLGHGAPCYVPKRVLPLEEVVSTIKASGGTAVWAHPGHHIRDGELCGRIFGCGVAGVEAWHPNHTEDVSGLIIKEAASRGLICTGGSDYHFDEAMKSPIGDIIVPCDSVADLRRHSSGLSS